MSITVVKDKGVTVVTVATDSQSMLPPVCQILKGLFYSPVCCSVKNGLKQSNTISVLGTIQIMVGLFSIGLGPGRTSFHPGDFAHLGYAYWLGGVFIFTGILSLIANRFPSSCMVGSAVVFNIVGSVVAIVGIVMYALDIADFSGDKMCNNYDPHEYSDCRSLEFFFKRLMTAMDVTMIVLVVLQLIACIIVSVTGSKALFHLRKEEQGGRDDEIHQPLLKEVLMTSPGA